MPNKIDVVGQRFGRISVTADTFRARNGRRRVQCVCDCGIETVVDPRLLLNGQTRSCGCLQKDAVRQAAIQRTRHGNSPVGHQSPTYSSWLSAKKRCFNPADTKYPDYGGSGITMCTEWAKSFDTFLADMGSRPSLDYSLDRIDPYKGYEPGNCRWATILQQARNRRHHRFVELDGKKMPLSEACEKTGINYRSALYRINVGRNWQPLPPPPGQ